MAATPTSARAAKTREQRHADGRTRRELISGWSTALRSWQDGACAPRTSGSPHPCRTFGVARPAERLVSTALSRPSLIRMKSEVQVLPGPPIRHLTSGNGHPFVSGPEGIAGQRSRPRVLRSCEPYNASDQQVQRLLGPRSEPFGSSHSGRRAHYRAGSLATAGLAVRGMTREHHGRRHPSAVAPAQADVSAAPRAEPTDPTSSGGSPMGRLSSYSSPTGLGRRAGRAGPGVESQMVV
jgi:hypothetical protein